MAQDVMVEAIFKFICDHWTQYGYGPTLREIADGCFISKPNVYRYLDRLEMAGRITRFPGHARSISIVIPCPPKKD